MCLLSHRYLGLLSVADPNALGPRVIEFCVAGTSASSKPRTAAPTTAKFAGLLYGAALGTYAADRRCDHCVEMWRMSNAHKQNVLRERLSSVRA